MQSSSSTNRAYRTVKRKFPNHLFPSKPANAREYINHPTRTSTNKFLQETLPFFPQYTYNHADPNPGQHDFVDEHVLIPTLHWTSPRQFTHVGFKKLLRKFTAPRANEYSIDYYDHDHNIIRPNQDQFLDDDIFANPQLTEIFFH